jgi:Fe-S cluster assembly iron-binding protein IscA
MFNVSENAVAELEAFFEDKPRSPIRIYLAPGGCSGPRLSLALDEAGAGDMTMEQNGFSFCIAKALWDEVGGLNIDLSYMGFSIEPEKPLPSSGVSGCASCGGGCH